MTTAGSPYAHKGGDDHGYYKDKEPLPLVGLLAWTMTGGLPTGGLTAGDTSSLPVAGDLGSGVKASKVNVAGVDPMGMLNQVPPEHRRSTDPLSITTGRASASGGGPASGAN